MRLISFEQDGRHEIGVLADEGGSVLRLAAAAKLASGAAIPAFADMRAFLASGAGGRDFALQVLDWSLARRPEDLFPQSRAVTWLAPVPRPASIRDFMGFEQHVLNSTRSVGFPRWLAKADSALQRRVGGRRSLAGRLNKTWYQRPVYYKGNRYSVVGPGADVPIPAGETRFDYELEFGVFLCRGGRDIKTIDARSHIGGYCLFNDFSARDAQLAELGGRLGPAKGKDFDAGNALGPMLVTPDELFDPYALTLTARINDIEVSYGSSADMAYSFEEMIAYVSRGETLNPGEFFGSGTCSGAEGKGCGLEHGRYLHAGDVIELEGDGLGVLLNHVVAQG